MAQVARLQLEDRVRFLGHRSDVPHLLAQAAVFVLPSRFEGMPNALLEAMAQGLAVVVSDASPGPLEEIDHGRSGWVVPSEDVGALAQALEHLAADPSQRQRLGGTARDQVLSRDWSQLAPVWDEVLGGT